MRHCLASGLQDRSRFEHSLLEPRGLVETHVALGLMNRCAEELILHERSQQAASHILEKEKTILGPS